MAIDLWDLRVGDVIDLGEDILATVLLPTQDGQWVVVTYESFPASPDLQGKTDLVSDAEVLQVFRSSLN